MSINDRIVREYNTFTTHRSTLLGAVAPPSSLTPPTPTINAQDEESMRPRPPVVSWTSTFTSWAITVYVLIYFFLPRRYPQLEIPVRVGEDTPSPASMGTWSIVQSAHSGDDAPVKWFLDEAAMRIISCSRPADEGGSSHTSGTKHKDDDKTSSSSNPKQSTCRNVIDQARVRLIAMLAAQEQSSGATTTTTPAPHRWWEVSREQNSAAKKEQQQGNNNNNNNNNNGSHTSGEPNKSSPLQYLQRLSLVEFFDIWAFQPRRLSPIVDLTAAPLSHPSAAPQPPNPPSYGFVSAFAKAFLSITNADDANAASRWHEGSNTTTSSGHDDGERPIMLVDIKVMLREGTLVTSPLTYMRFYGSATTGLSPQFAEQPPQEGGSGATYVLLGMAPPTFGKVALSTMTGANGNAPLEELVADLQKRDAANMTVVLSIFNAALLHQTRGSVVSASAAMAAADASLSRSEGKKHHKSVTRSNESQQQAHTEPMISGKCLWFGTLHASQLSAAATTHRNGDDPSQVESHRSSNDVLHRGIVEADLFSTCGDHMRWITSEKQFDEFVSSWNMILFVLGVVPSTLLAAGLLKQLAHIRNSRARTLRISRPALVVLVIYLLTIVCYVEILWGIMPGNIRMTNLLYTILFMDVMFLLTLYSQVDSEQRRADQQEGRAPLLFIYFGCSAIGNFLPIIARSALFAAPVLCIASGLLWAPQIVHLLRGKGRDGVIPSLLVSASLVPMSFVSLFLFGPLLDANSVSAHPSPLLLVVALLEVVLCGVVIHVGSKLGVGRLCPKWMMPWVHDYNIARNKVATIASLVEDPDCSICGESFEHPDDMDSVTATDQVWVTPCRHLFHQSCLSQWMEQRMDCPLCRKVLPEP